jgi:hypothetical protein
MWTDGMLSLVYKQQNFSTVEAYESEIYFAIGIISQKTLLSLTDYSLSEMAKTPS